LTGPDAERHQDESDILWVKDLRCSWKAQQEFGKRGLEQEERRPHVAEHLGSPTPADHLIVSKDTSVRLQFAPDRKCDDEALVPETHQLRKVTGPRL
jgi:hypothetical protein